MKKQFSVTTIVQAAMIAALYVVLTLLANVLGLANYAVQVRFSEALTILPYFTPAAIPGLFIGCLLSNMLTGCAVPDIIFGSLATLLAAVLTYRLRRFRWLAPIPPIAANAVVVPFVLLYAYGVGPLWLSFITVTIGEIISCGVLGMILLSVLDKYKGRLFVSDFHAQSEPGSLPMKKRPM
ncbi:MAG: QueT transporter family protein [Lachnospiraceae bacterium]|nr:QueT transporter family protein [Lachnospiraceae bacterium]